MPRTKLPKFEKILLAEGWKTFGLWLQSQRLLKRLTQQQAAEATGVSKRQWIRYEMGSKVLFKRLDPIARALSISPRRILYLAGYEVPPKRNDASYRLRRMHDMLLAGSLDSALGQLLELYDEIRPGDCGRSSRSRLDGAMAPNFARAVVFLDALPSWLLEEILKAMQARPNRDGHRTNPRVKNRVRKKMHRSALRDVDDTDTDPLLVLSLDERRLNLREVNELKQLISP